MDPRLKQAQQQFRAGDFDRALNDYGAILKKEPDNYKVIIAKARCQLALSHTDAASFTYRAILKYPQSPLNAQAEAQIFLGKYKEASAHIKQFLKAEPHNNEASFLSALCSYKLGNISASLSALGNALKEGFTWEDDEPVDFLLQHVLRSDEFNDFEQIYLDVFEAGLEGKSSPQNRWFSINMPVYELFAASPGKQKAKVHLLENLLGITPYAQPLEQGDKKLLQILQDFSRSQQDARFGLEAMKTLDEKNYPKLASLILGMQLEHLKSFGDFFGLDEKTISTSQLQSLIPLLPQRIAIILMFLYTASDPKDKIQKMALENLDSNVLLYMLSVCFSTFYQEINTYKQYQN